MATAPALQDGVEVKSGDATRLFLGLISGSHATGVYDFRYQRGIGNRYNTIKKELVHEVGSIGNARYTLSWGDANNWHSASSATPYTSSVSTMNWEGETIPFEAQIAIIGCAAMRIGVAFLGSGGCGYPQDRAKMSLDNGGTNTPSMFRAGNLSVQCPFGYNQFDLVTWLPSGGSGYIDHVAYYAPFEQQTKIWAYIDC